MTATEKLQANKDEVVRLFREAAKAKLQVWANVRKIEKLTGLELDTQDILDDYCIGLHEPDDADKLDPDWLVGQLADNAEEGPQPEDAEDADNAEEDS